MNDFFIYISPIYFRSLSWFPKVKGKVRECKMKGKFRRGMKRRSFRIEYSSCKFFDLHTIFSTETLTKISRFSIYETINRPKEIAKPA